VKRLPYGRQEILPEDIDAVVEVLGSDFITQGPVVARFEDALTAYCGASHAVAVNSATSALHLACLALELAPGGLAWTTPNTFVATANCIRLCGAAVDFVDIDPRTYNLCAEALELKLRIRQKAGGQMPSVLIVVDFAGQPCDLKAIRLLADEFGFRIIEDASHAIGGRYFGTPIGACIYSDITVFSFHPVKIITTGEGGAALCNCPDLHEKMSLHRTHGVRKRLRVGDAVDEPWRYEQLTLGLNYRMTDIHAALGLSQLIRLDNYVEQRHRLALRYKSLLDPLNYSLPFQAGYGYSSYHLFPILVGEPEDGGVERLRLYQAMITQGIGVNVHYIPVHTQPYYQQAGHRLGDYPVAESYYSRTLSLPIFGSMTEQDQDRVIEVLYDAAGYSQAA